MTTQEILPVLLERCAKRFDVTVEDILGGSRKSEIIDAKRAFCHIAYAKYSSAIVAAVCGIDHATVLSHNKKCRDYMKTEIDYERKVLQLRNWFNKQFATSTFRPRITKHILPFV